MPEQVRCPSCDAALRVPEDLLGMAVKCPKCETTFTATVEKPPPPAAIVTEVPERRSVRMPAPEDEPFDGLEDEDYPRQRFVDAESAVAGPAIGLMVVAGLNLLAGVLNLLLPLLGLSLVAAGPGGAKAAGSPDFMVNMVSGAVQGIVAFASGILILIGAIKMKKVQSYGFAMTACILAMIPCVSCCLVGLPFGIWGLVVLNKPEVKDAFMQRPVDSMDEMQ